MRFLAILAILATVALACVTCRRETTTEAPSPTAIVGAPSSPSGARRGLDAPGNDPAVLALAKKALACTWNNGFGDCEAYRSWQTAQGPLGGGRADTTLIALLEDDDERVRGLAADALATFGSRYRNDSVLSLRIVVQAEREKSSTVAPPLGQAVAKINVQKSDVFERVRAIAKKHDLTPLRSAIALRLLEHNPTVRAVHDLMRELVRDPDKQVRAAAVKALWAGGGHFPVDTCAVWAELLDDPDDDIAALCSRYVAWWGRCQDKYEALLEAEQRRAVAVRVRSTLHVEALTHVCRDDRAPDAQKQRAFALIRGLAEQGTVERQVRLRAVEGLLECDPVAGRAAVQRLSRDPDGIVAQVATELLKPKRTR